MVGATRVELARVFVLDQRHPPDSKSGASSDSATLRLSSYGRCPPREGDRESPSHWPIPRARPSRRLADSRRLGQQVKAAASFRLLSGFQAEDGKPRRPLGLNTFQAAACSACLAWYFPGSGRAIRFSITNRTRVDRREFILSVVSRSAIAIFAAVKASELNASRYRITRSVSGPSENAFAAVRIVMPGLAADSSFGKSESICTSSWCSLSRVAAIWVATSMICSRLFMVLIPLAHRFNENYIRA